MMQLLHLSVKEVFRWKQQLEECFILVTEAEKMENVVLKTASNVGFLTAKSNYQKIIYKQNLDETTEQVH